MRAFVVYILFLFAISCQITRADDFADSEYESEDSYEEVYIPEALTFKPLDLSDGEVILSTAPDKPSLIVTICYDDSDRGYYCKDLP
jgi:hypothetical protein